VLFLLKLLSLGSEQQYFLQATRKLVAFFYLFLNIFNMYLNLVLIRS